MSGKFILKGSEPMSPKVYQERERKISFQTGKTRTENLLGEIEKLAFNLEPPNSTTPQIIGCVNQLMELHKKMMFFVQDCGALELARKTCAKYKSLGLSRELALTQLTTTNRGKKSYPVDVAMEAINSVFGLEMEGER